MAQMKYYYELTISSSPHVHSPVTTQTIMRDVLIALCPALIGSVYFFGFRALMVTLISVSACVFFEWLWCKLMKQSCKVYDLSACVTGVLLALSAPSPSPTGRSCWVLPSPSGWSRCSSAAWAVTWSTPPWLAVPS